MSIFFKKTPLKNKSIVKTFFQLITFFIVFNFSHSLQAQLSDLHYLPPLRQRAADMNNQAVYLSTPETTAFSVNIYQGTAITPIATVSVSNVAPFKYTLPNGQNDITMVNAVNVVTVASVFVGGEVENL